jgi:DinB superfamily
MNNEELFVLQYPIGKFQPKTEYTQQDIQSMMEVIASFPSLLMKLTAERSDVQLDRTYRPDGWSARQIVHHCSDSHINAYIRLKLALTEEAPVIKPYDEGRWAELPDSQLPIDVSLNILEAIHYKWIVLMQNMAVSDWERSYVHPQYQKTLTLYHFLDLYAWHCRHHYRHVEIALGA